MLQEGNLDNFEGLLIMYSRKEEVSKLQVPSASVYHKVGRLNHPSTDADIWVVLYVCFRCIKCGLEFRESQA